MKAQSSLPHSQQPSLLKSDKKFKSSDMSRRVVWKLVTDVWSVQLSFSGSNSPSPWTAGTDFTSRRGVTSQNT